MNILAKIMQVPTFGKPMFNSLKKNAFSAFQVPLEKAIEKQTRFLRKFARMETTDIGIKLDARSGIKPESVPFTNYDFYAHSMRILLQVLSCILLKTIFVSKPAVPRVQKSDF